ncbi:HIT domain-containing protein [Reticulomyxa filosa]|uniref:HIT domain-containing protein n=1 Tax=Reticulomyxa filosa TaxID=46433 RepID=X6NTK8_RETFI|nr:HIT domain-containing protein [Reticulomyxa filosa]|eukprot:ETO29316.1 HIT domain-containing protein [Reticulomyxa filosa]
MFQSSYKNQLLTVSHALTRRHLRQPQTLIPRFLSHGIVNISYVQGNPFQKIVNGQLSYHKVFETDDAIALLDAFPTVKGHCLLIPKAHNKATVMDLTENEASNFFSQLPKLCRIVQQAMKAPGVNVLNNNGKAAGQAVFHLHYHVVPRFERDGFQGIRPSKTMITNEEASEILAAMKPFIDQETKGSSS